MADLPRSARPPRQMTELHLLRYVDRASPVHRLWAGTKMLCLLLISVAVAARPTWWGVAALFVVVAGVMLVARIPLGALPRLPRWFWIGVGISGVIAVSAGGDGAIRWLRFMCIVILLGLSASMLGWTTRLSDVGPALRRLLAPLRRLRVPVDEIVHAVALSMRCLPMLTEEMRVLQAVRRSRRALVRPTVGEAARDVADLLVNALVMSVRRAREMAEAMDARGGLGPVAKPPVRFRWADVFALGLSAAGASAIYLA